MADGSGVKFGSVNFGGGSGGGSSFTKSINDRERRERLARLDAIAAKELARTHRRQDSADVRTADALERAIARQAKADARNAIVQGRQDTTYAQEQDQYRQKLAAENALGQQVPVGRTTDVVTPTARQWAPDGSEVAGVRESFAGPGVNEQVYADPEMQRIMGEMNKSGQGAMPLPVQTGKEQTIEAIEGGGGVLPQVASAMMNPRDTAVKMFKDKIGQVGSDIGEWWNTGSVTDPAAVPVEPTDFEKEQAAFAKQEQGTTDLTKQLSEREAAVRKQLGDKVIAEQGSYTEDVKSKKLKTAADFRKEQTSSIKDTPAYKSAKKEDRAGIVAKTLKALKGRADEQVSVVTQSVKDEQAQKIQKTKTKGDVAKAALKVESKSIERSKKRIDNDIKDTIVDMKRLDTKLKDKDLTDKQKAYYNSQLTDIEGKLAKLRQQRK